jgi:hypothetical protein
MTTTRQPEGKSTRKDVHFSALLLGSGGTGIQSSKSWPGSPKDQPRMGVDLLVRVDCTTSSPEERQQKALEGSSLRASIRFWNAMANNQLTFAAPTLGTRARCPQEHD